MKARFQQFLSWLYIHQLWGPRCRDFEPGCATCRHWEEHDQLFNDLPFDWATDAIVRCYMDGIDWQHHIGRDNEAVLVHATGADLKDIMRGPACGVAEVEVSFVRWVIPQDYIAEIDAAKASRL